MISNGPSEAPLWLCLNFRQLPIEVFIRVLSEPERQKPIVVLERHRICQLNDAARDIGIVVGNNMDTAYTLSEQITSFERDETKEYNHLSHLAQWAYQFTPNISIKAPDSLLLDITGCLRLFKGLPSLVQKIRDGLDTLGYQPAIGVNQTPLAALISAKSGNPDTTVDSINALPVSHLSVDDKIIDGITQMGIVDIGRLLALPMGGLTRRFGVFFADYLERMTGAKPDPQKFIGPEPKFSSEVTFLADVTNTQALVFPVKRLITELCEFLKARQLCVNHLTFRLAHRSHPPGSFSIYLANPENDPAIFLPLTQLKLDRLQGIREIDNIRLSAHHFFPSESSPGDLFQGTTFRQKDGRLNSTAARSNATYLLNLLNTRLGPGTCYGLSVADDHRPEKAWQLVRLHQKARWQPLGDSDENPRLVFLLDTPRPLGIVTGHPCLGGKLELLKGPERIDFGWWDEDHITQPIARDYYVARQTSGALFWIFNRADNIGENKRWYLHGIFS